MIKRCLKAKTREMILDGTTGTAPTGRPRNVSENGMSHLVGKILVDTRNVCTGSGRSHSVYKWPGFNKAK